MKPVLFLVTAGLAACAGLGAIACGNGDDAYYPAPVTVADGGADASKLTDATLGGADGGEAGADDGDAGDAGQDDSTLIPTLALLRFANWSADSPAIDFCLARHGTGAFQGPVLAESAAAIDDAGVIHAGSGALPFPQATAYLLFDPAQYDARLVAAGSTDCSTAITRDATSLPVLASGGLETIALVGAAHPQPGQPGLQIVGFLDDRKSNLPTAFELRVINAAPDLPKVDLGTLSNGLFQLSVAGVPFGASSAVIENVGRSSPDSNGYLPVAPLVDGILAASPSVATLLDGSAGTIVAQTSPLNVGVGLIVTIAVIGTRAPTAAGIVECLDNAASVGLEGTCNVVSQ